MHREYDTFKKVVNVLQRRCVIPMRGTDDEKECVPESDGGRDGWPGFVDDCFVCRCEDAILQTQ